MKETIFFAASALLFAAASSQAAVIYSQTFTGGPTGTLNATTVDTSSGTLGGTAGAAWNSNSNFQANGTLSATTRSMALLPFVPQTGQLYELTATVSLNTSGFLGIGFCDDINFAGGVTNNDRMITGTAVNYGMMFITAAIAPAGYTTYSSGATTINSNTALPAALSSYDLKIVLDTTAPAWAVQYYINGGLVSSFTHAASTPIDSIGFTAGNALATATYANFQLQTIPEPGAALLGSLGVLGLLRRRRN